MTDCAAKVEAFLDAVDGDPLQAWVHVDGDRLLADAQRLDALAPAARERLSLFGMLVGVKDNFDTADAPTTYGSPIYEGHRPATDAEAVTRLRRAGALVAGKTALAEFATIHPPSTLNPIDRRRTPGGSSTGSAVAVAAGHVPVATGTQTAGSINRPASYCGVIGFKPTFGLIPVEGIKPVAPSLDTAGVLGSRLDDVVKLAAVLAGRSWHAGPGEAAVSGGDWPRIAFAQTPLWDQVESQARSELLAVARRLAAEAVELPQTYTELVTAQATLQMYEAARSLACEHAQHRELLSDALRDALDAGAALSIRARDDALRTRDTFAPALIGVLQQFDGVLTPSATGVPPLGTRSTGDPLFARVWTLIGAPSISLPLAWTASPRLPVGLALVGAPNTDERLLRAAAALLERGGAS